MPESANKASRKPRLFSEEVRRFLLELLENHPVNGPVASVRKHLRLVDKAKSQILADGGHTSCPTEEISTADQ